MVVGEKYSSYYVLVHFHEEKKFSVLRLKEAVPDCLNISDSYDLNKWDRSTEVETKWGSETFPAFFIQFGENKKMMDETIDEIAASGDASNVPLLQTANEKRSKKRKLIETAGPKMHKSKKLNNGSSVKLLTEVKEKLEAQREKSQLEKAAEPSGEDLKVRAELLMEKELYMQLQAKYAELKKKYKAVKRELKELKTPELIKIGDNLRVRKDKLALCRTHHFSKYVADLLEIQFGSDVLANAVLKGVKKSNTKTIVLDKDIVNDVIAHVVNKYSVTVSMVRAAIRQKLNSAHKLNKKHDLCNDIIDNV